MDGRKSGIYENNAKENARRWNGNLSQGKSHIINLSSFWARRKLIFSLIHFWAGLPLPSLLLSGFKFHQQHDNESGKLFPLLFNETPERSIKQRKPNPLNLISLKAFHYSFACLLSPTEMLRWLEFHEGENNNFLHYLWSWQVCQFSICAKLRSTGCVVWRAVSPHRKKPRFHHKKLQLWG